MVDTRTVRSVANDEQHARGGCCSARGIGEVAALGSEVDGMAASGRAEEGGGEVAVASCVVCDGHKGAGELFTEAAGEDRDDGMVEGGEADRKEGMSAASASG